jgi:DNA-directed RNA polymerase subunit RPC12/RpoP
MAKLVEYFCLECSNPVEEIYNDTEVPAEHLDRRCEKCGGVLQKGLNVKNNCQRERWRDA